jgi:cysteine-rich repeat protein
MRRLLVPLVAVGLLASPVAGGLACSRTGLQPAMAMDAASDGRDGVGAGAGDGSVAAETARPTELPAGPRCGDGHLDRGEECDDGNTLDGDDCTRDCRLDYCGSCGGMCPGCPPGLGVRCGNGQLAPDEACDDGNMATGDGCSGDCKAVEAGFHCPVPGKRCVPICGDGLVIGGETCDDGNTLSGDGCSRICQSEPDDAVCGDGMTTPDEACDCGDGAVPLPEGCLGANDDDAYGGCTTKCTWGAFCGDGMVNGPEQCDLGKNNVAVYGPDGCTIGCTKPHYCGDGLVDTYRGEECDLGDKNGRKLDREQNPSDSPDAFVWCHIDCTIPYPSFF